MGAGSSGKTIHHLRSCESDVPPMTSEEPANNRMNVTGPLRGPQVILSVRNTLLDIAIATEGYQ